MAELDLAVAEATRNEIKQKLVDITYEIMAKIDKMEMDNIKELVAEQKLLKMQLSAMNSVLGTAKKDMGSGIEGLAGILSSIGSSIADIQQKL